MTENFDKRVKEWFPLKNGKLIVKLEDDEGLTVRIKRNR